MAVKAPEPIELTEPEKALRSQIRFDFDPHRDREAIRECCDVTGELRESLLERDAIPLARWEFFTEEEHNVGPGLSQAVGQLRQTGPRPIIHDRVHNNVSPGGGNTSSPAQDVHVKSGLRQKLTDVQCMVGFRRRVWGKHRNDQHSHQQGTLRSVPVKSRPSSLPFMTDREDERPSRGEP